MVTGSRNWGRRIPCTKRRMKDPGSFPELSPEGWTGIIHVMVAGVWWKSVPGRGSRMCKSPGEKEWNI